MKFVSSVLLLLPLAVSADYYSNKNPVNNVGGAGSVPYVPPSSTASGTYTSSNGNTYVNQNSNNYNSAMQGSSGMGGAGMGGAGMGGNSQDPASMVNAMSVYGGSMMTMMFGQCLTGIDMNKLQQDPFVDIKNRCSDSQAATFHTALDEFKTCSGFDLELLIEDFGSLYFGLVMNCGSYAMDVKSDLEMIGTGVQSVEELKKRESPLPRVPKECVDALVGKNPFGTAFLYAEEYPEREQKCFAELAGKLPMCTLSEWPIPIVGNYLSAISCIYGNANDVLMPMMQDSIMKELNMLYQCIPQDITASNCKDIRNECVFGFDVPAGSMAMPPPFAMPPMNQNNKDLATKNGMGDLVEKYEKYRQTCIPAADLAIWEIVAEEKKDASGTGGVTAYIEEKNTAAPEELASPVVAAVPPAAATKTSTKFMPGMFVGMIVAFAGMFGFHKYKQNGSQMPLGYHFNSLELSEGPTFS